MKKQTWLRLLAVLFAFGLIAAACGDDDDSSDAVAVEGALTGVCPDPLVIQTDWWPEAEHGAMYELIGDDYVVDVEGKGVSGSMVSGGVNTGVQIEVRAGGPAIGFSAPRVQMYTDNSITIGYTSNDGQILATNDAPTLAVMAPLEQNPQMVMWDPATYPDVETMEDIGEAGITVNVFGGGTFPDVFVAQGIWSADQLDASYDGTPARFIAENGAIAQQGFASSEPYNYENVYEEWGNKDLAFQLVHDAGFEIYSQPLGIKSGDLEELRPCLEKFVPIAQQATVDFAGSPARANAIIVDVVAQFDAGWVYGDAVAAFGANAMTELGLNGNGPDDIVGNFDIDRVQGVIDAMSGAGMDVPDGLSASDIVTNEFIDESIGF